MREKAGGRGDKEEEEEERSKPLSFSTPGARRTTGDAARRLHPSPPLGSRGAGDTAAVADVSRGSVHPRHGQRGEWGGRGGREGCNLNPLPSH